MPKVSEVFGTGRFLKHADLSGQARTVTIEGWSEEAGYNGASLYVLHLVNERQALRLNQTLAHDIGRLHGDDIETWSGHVIELYPDEMKITDRDTKLEKMVDVIRARAAAGAATPALRPTASARPPLDDEIPF